MSNLSSLFSIQYIPSFSGVTTLTGIIDSAAFSKSDSPVDAANNSAQIAAAVSGAFASASNGKPIVGIGAALAAEGTASIALDTANNAFINDRLDGKSFQVLAADSFTILGDDLLMQSAAANALGLGGLADATDMVGTYLTIGSLFVKYYPGSDFQQSLYAAGLAPPINDANDANLWASMKTVLSSSLDSFWTNTVSNSLAGSLYSSTSASISAFDTNIIQAALAPEINNTNDATLLTSFETSFSGAAKTLSNILNNANSTNNTSANVSQSLDSIESSLKNMANDAGITTPSVTGTVAADGTVTVAENSSTSGATNKGYAIIADTSTGASISYAASDTANVSMGSTGDLLVSLANTSTSSSVGSIDLSSGSVSLKFGSTTLSFAAADSNVAVDNSGNATLTSSAFGDGADSLNILANGSGSTFTANGTSIDFAQGLLSGVSQGSNGTVNFSLNSGTAGVGENIQWNAATDSANLNVTDTSGQTTSASLGTLATGSTLQVSGATASISDAAGQQTSSTTINSDGTYDVTTPDDTGSTTYTYNNLGQTTAYTRTNDDGSYESQVYNPTNGALAQQAIGNADGSYSLIYNDPATGQWQQTRTFDSNGNLTSETSASGVTQSQFVDNLANTLATQVITQFIFKNNLPASLVAQAFSKAGIQTVWNYVNGQSPTLGNFTQAFATSLTNLAGGMLGSDLGADLFKSLGLPPQIGGALGQAVGSVATQQLTTYIARDVLHITTAGTTVLDGSLTTTGFIDSLGSSIESAGISLVAAEATTQLERLLEPNGNPTGEEIGGDIGGLIGDIWGPIGSAIGSTLGSLLGGLFGPGPSVGPNAGVGVYWNGSQYVWGAPGADNGGDINVAISIGNVVVSTLNEVLQETGGYVAKGANFVVGYLEGQYYSLDEINNPGKTSQYLYPTVEEALNNTIYQMLRQTSIVGGNILIEYTLAHSDATTADGLISDLNVAHDYALYIANPLAFDVSLANTNDPTQYQAWATELARAQALGLDQFVNTLESGLTVQNKVFYGTAADILANLTALQNLASIGLLTSIRFTDPGTPILTLTGSQGEGSSALLGALNGPHELVIVGGTPALNETSGPSGVTVADSGINVSANYDALEALATQGALLSVTLTDSAPVLWLSTAQAFTNNAVLKTIASSYELAISDTSANILANLSNLQALVTQGSLSAINLTDSDVPQFSLTIAELLVDLPVLSKITSSYGIAITDKAVTIQQNLATLETLATNGTLQSVTFSDSGTPTLSLTAAQVINDVDVLNEITSPYKIKITDSATAVVQYLDQLSPLAVKGTLSSITLTDTGTPILSITDQQYTADAAALAKIGGSYGLAISGIAAANAASIASKAYVVLVSVIDSSANIVAHLAALQALSTAGKIGSIGVTDANADNISKLYNLSNLVIFGISAADAASIASHAHVVLEGITDTAANVVANLAALEMLAAKGKIAWISLTDPGTPTILVTAAQFSANSAALNMLVNSYAITLTDPGTPTLVLTIAQWIADATSLGKITNAYNIVISDTAANISAHVDALEALAAKDLLVAITLTDKNTPNLTVTAAQLVNDAAALSKITGAYQVTVSDTLADILANLTALQTLPNAGQSIVISLTDAGMVGAASQLAKALSILARSSMTVVGTGYNSHTGGHDIFIEDVNNQAIVWEYNASGHLTVQTRLTYIEGGPALLDGSAIIGSGFDDSTGRSALVIQDISSTNPGQGIIWEYTPDGQVPFHIRLTYMDGSPAYIDSHVVVMAVGYQSEIFIRDVSDGCPGQAIIWQYNTNGQVPFHYRLTYADGSPVIIDSNAVIMGMGANASTGSYDVLIQNPDGQVIFWECNINGQLTTQANISVLHLASESGDTFQVTGTAANVTANLDVLQLMVASGIVSSIKLTDTGTPILSITDQQYTADAVALAKISGSCGLAISGIAAANAANIASKAHVVLVSVIDSSANVVANLAALETLAAKNKIASISLTDPGTPTVSVTAGQFSANIAALNKLVNSYSITLTDPGTPTLVFTTAQLTADTALLSKITNAYKVAISDTAANISADFDALEALAAKNMLASITPTDAAWNLHLTVAQMTKTDVPALGTIKGVGGLIAVDTLANVAAGFSGLLPLATVGVLYSIILTDKTTPSLSISSTQLMSDMALLKKITSAYTIKLTNTGTPVISLTTAQLTSDAATLAKISSPYSLAVTGVTAAAATSIAANTHVTSLSLSDTQANIQSALAVLESLSAKGKLGAIQLTDKTTPTFTLTAAQLSSGAAVLAKITSPFNEIVLADDHVSENLSSPKIAGTSTISFAGDTSGVTVNLSTGVASESVTSGGKTNLYTDGLGLTYTKIIGSTHNDTLIAGAAAETLTGNGGKDIYTGFSGGATTFSDLSKNINGTTITNFIKTDVIDITDLVSSHATIAFTENTAGTSGTLSVTDGTHAASIALLGQFMAAGFHESKDSGAGTVISYTPPAASPLTLAVSH